MFDPQIKPPFTATEWARIIEMFKELQNLYQSAVKHNFQNAHGKFFLEQFMRVCSLLNDSMYLYVRHSTASSGDNQPGSGRWTQVISMSRASSMSTEQSTDPIHPPNRKKPHLVQPEPHLVPPQPQPRLPLPTASKGKGKGKGSAQLKSCGISAATLSGSGRKSSSNISATRPRRSKLLTCRLLTNVEACTRDLSTTQWDLQTGSHPQLEQDRAATPS